MIFQLEKVVTASEKLNELVNDKRFITYANVNSFRVDPTRVVKYHFVADGWPVAVYSSYLLKHKVGRMSFFRCSQEWVKYARDKRVALIGHNEEDLKRIKKSAKQIKVEFEFMQHGYLDDDQLVKIIIKKCKNIDILFLAVSQPRQEVIMDRVSELEGKVVVACCGAFWLQELNLIKGVSRLATIFGLVPLFRFYHSPFELIKRTLFSIPYMFLKLR